MTPHQLAALQRPWVKGDLISRRRLEALSNAIREACKSGGLAHEQREVTLYKTETRSYPRVRHTSIGDMWESTTKNVQVPYQDQIQYVAAAPFAEWLRTQGEEPSQHIAHWFKVRGVATGAQVLELVQPASATPATWTELLTYHRANEGHEWTPELKTIIAREHARRQGEKGLAKAMANELGLTASRLNELIRKKDAISIRKVIANRRTGT